MANQVRNGRNNVAVPDENRPSWRPQDERGQRNRRSMSDDDHYMRDREEDDRYMSRDRGSYWGDRDTRFGRDDERSTESYGQGQSGYGAGRYEDDRSYQSRNQGYRGYGDGNQGWGNEAYSGSAGHQPGGMYGHGPGSWSYGQPSPFGPRGSQGYQGFGQPSHRGKGPSGYMRSDERIRDMVCEALTDDHHVDATHIEIIVKDGEVTLSGTVEDRQQKRMAEDCIEHIPGVKDVHNQLRIARDARTSGKEPTHKDTESSTGVTGDKRHRA